MQADPDLINGSYAFLEEKTAFWSEYLLRDQGIDNIQCVGFCNSTNKSHVTEEIVEHLNKLLLDIDDICLGIKVLLPTLLVICSLHSKKRIGSLLMTSC